MAVTAQGGTSDARGILYPTRLPTFHRAPAPEELAGLVRWTWVPRWDLAPGRTSRQRVLPFPASHLVVEPSGVSLVGPGTGASHRDLTGSGWAVGLMLRPAGLASLVEDARTLRDREVPFDAPDLHAAVVEAMGDADDAGRDRAVRAATGWAAAHLGRPDAAGATANAMEELIASDPGIVRVEQVADHLHLSVRGVQRLAGRYVGLAPLAMIRRYRLQEAAQRLREDPGLTIARVAADLGYADHAHLTTDFRTVLRLTPSDYRRSTEHDGSRR